MADFTKYTNYTEDTSFSSVVFGAYAPVLEVEQNEIQAIQETKFKRLTEIIGSCVHPMSNGSIVLSGTTLTLTNCVVLAHGFSAFIPSASVSLSASNKYAYIKLEEKTVNGNTNLKSYGLTTGSAISNPINDVRVGKETSRRKLIEVTIVSGSSIPSDTDTIKYVPIGVLESGEFIAEYALDSLVDLGLSVDSDGALCVTYDDE